MPAQRNQFIDGNSSRISLFRQYNTDSQGKSLPANNRKEASPSNVFPLRVEAENHKAYEAASIYRHRSVPTNKSPHPKRVAGSNPHGPLSAYRLSAGNRYKSPFVSIAATFVIYRSVKVLDVFPVHNYINDDRRTEHRSHGIQRQYVMRTRQYHQQITKQRDARTGQQRYRNQHLMIG